MGKVLFLNPALCFGINQTTFVIRWSVFLWVKCIFVADLTTTTTTKDLGELKANYNYLSILDYS